MTIINKYSPKQILFKPDLQIDLDLCEYIHTKTSIDIEKIYNILRNELKNDMEMEEITIQNTLKKTTYNIRTGFLKHNDKKYNYLYDVKLKKKYENTSKLKDDYTLDTIEECEQIVTDFINNKFSILSLKAKWGSGKSHQVLKRVMLTHRNTHRILIISENNALNQKTLNDYINFIKSHLQAQTSAAGKLNNVDFDYSHLVCSVESIARITLNDTRPIILILDEYESIINQFESSTVENKYNSWCHFAKIVKKSDKILCMDADLSNERLEILDDLLDTVEINKCLVVKNQKETLLDKFITKTEDENKIIYSKKHIIVNALNNNFWDCKFNLLVDKTNWVEDILKDVMDCKKIAIASCSNGVTEDLYNNVLKTNEKTNILLIHQSGITMSCDGVEIERNNGNIKFSVLLGLENHILEHDISVFIYSPTIKTGVSINSQIFDKSYAYGCNNSVVDREFIQMIFRCRDLKDKEFNFFLNTGYNGLKTYKTTDDVMKCYIHNQLVNLRQNIVKNKEVVPVSKEDIANFKHDKIYLKMRSINGLETHTSLTSFTEGFMLKMKYNHGIHINFVDKKEEIGLIDTSGLTRKQVNVLELQHTKLITTAVYDKLTFEINKKRKQQNTETTIEEEDEDEDELYDSGLDTLTDAQIKSNEIKKESEKITEIPAEIKLQRQKYKIFHILNIANFKNISEDEKIAFHDILNTKEFYNHYIKNGLVSRFLAYQKCLFNANFHKIDNDKTTDDDIVNSAIDKMTETRNKEHIICELLKTKIFTLGSVLTNKEFEKLCNSEEFVEQLHKLIVPFYSNLQLGDKYKQIYDIVVGKVTKAGVGKIKQMLNDLLHHINHKIAYVDQRNTSRSSDKMVIGQIKNDEFKTPYQEKLLNDIILSIDIQQTVYIWECIDDGYVKNKDGKKSYETQPVDVKNVGVKRGGGFKYKDIKVYKNSYGRW